MIKPSEYEEGPFLESGDVVRCKPCGKTSTVVYDEPYGKFRALSPGWEFNPVYHGWTCGQPGHRPDLEFLVKASARRGGDR